MNKPNSGLGVGPRPQIAAWVHHHRQSASDSLQKMLLEPLSTVLTWLVVGIALALPSALLLLLDNVDELAGTLESPSRLSLLLESSVSVEAAAEFANAIEARVDIDVVKLVSKDQALQAFIEDTGLGGLLESLGENPLPNTLLVYPAAGLDPSRLDALADALGEQDVVDEVVYDTRWQSRLEAALEFGRRLALGLGTLMVVGAVLILGNTIRLAIESRRDEIVVIKLIGGGDAFARRPFLYTGLWAGIGGGVFAALLVALFLVYIGEPIGALMSLYDSRFVFSGLGIVQALNLILTGGFLGLLSAWQAAGLHLRRVEPR